MKLKAKSRTDVQKSHLRLNKGGRACKPKRSPKVGLRGRGSAVLSKPFTVNGAVTWEEGCCSYPGRSGGTP